MQNKEYALALSYHLLFVSVRSSRRCRNLGRTSYIYHQKMAEFLRNVMWGMFIAGGVIYTLQNIQENTERYLDMKTRTEVVAERNTNKAFPITTICLNSMHSQGRCHSIELIFLILYKPDYWKM
jgi:ribosomal protein L22